MADRIVEDTLESIPEIPERLQAVLIASLKEARERLEKGESVVPFTALAVKENLFLESHPADDTQQCFNLARHTVQNVRGADAYALCYDGYVETDDGTKDALIAEGGIAGDDGKTPGGKPRRPLRRLAKSPRVPRNSAWIASWRLG